MPPEVMKSDPYKGMSEISIPEQQTLWSLVTLRLAARFNQLLLYFW